MRDISEGEPEGASDPPWSFTRTVTPEFIMVGRIVLHGSEVPFSRMVGRIVLHGSEVPFSRMVGRIVLHTYARTHELT